MLPYCRRCGAPPACRRTAWTCRMWLPSRSARVEVQCLMGASLESAGSGRRTKWLVRQYGRMIPGTMKAIDSVEWNCHPMQGVSEQKKEEIVIFRVIFLAAVALALAEIFVSSFYESILMCTAKGFAPVIIYNYLNCAYILVYFDYNNFNIAFVNGLFHISPLVLMIISVFLFYRKISYIICISYSITNFLISIIFVSETRTLVLYNSFIDIKNTASFSAVIYETLLDLVSSLIIILIIIGFSMKFIVGLTDSK